MYQYISAWVPPAKTQQEETIPHSQCIFPLYVGIKGSTRLIFSKNMKLAANKLFIEIALR